MELSFSCHSASAQRKIKSRSRVEEPAIPTNSSSKLSTAEVFRLGEASVRLEGFKPNDEPEYEDLKARVIAGEIDVDEMVDRILALHDRTSSKVFAA